MRSWFGGGSDPRPRPPLYWSPMITPTRAIPIRNIPIRVLLITQSLADDTEADVGQQKPWGAAPLPVSWLLLVNLTIL